MMVPAQTSPPDHARIVALPPYPCFAVPGTGGILSPGTPQLLRNGANRREPGSPPARGPAPRWCGASMGNHTIRPISMEPRSDPDRYSSRIIKAGALLADTKTLLA